MNNDIALEVTNLTKIYKLYDDPIERLKEALHWRGKKYHKDFYALNNVSFKVQKGDVLGIVGKNGSGKSTLLKIITGVLTPTSGKVQVNGRVSALLELGAGFNPEYTGLENIYFQGSLMGYTEEEMKSKVEEILEFADIGEFIHQPVKSYSSGMFARLAFAVAINVEPDILIVDEALSVGDMAFQSRCFSKFKEFKEKGVTILFVTHSTDLVIKHCNRALLLNEGVKIIEGGSKDTIEAFRKLMVNLVRKSIDEKQDFRKLATKTNCFNLKEHLSLNTKPVVYGSMEAEIIDFGILNSKDEVTNQIYHGEEYTIQLTVKFHAEVLEPIFAYTIKSADGLELTGTNSLNLEQNFGKVKAQEVIIIRFGQVMILNSGNYLLSLGCTKLNATDFTVFHRIYDACTIEVISITKATGIAFSLSSCEFEKHIN